MTRIRLWETADCTVEIGGDAAERSSSSCPGGLDSTVCMALAGRGRRPPLGPHLRLRAAPPGRARAGRGGRRSLRRRATGGAHRPHRWGGSALTDERIDVPDAGAARAPVIPVTYVPARNLIFLSVAMGMAEARDADAVYIGVNALDYSGYPDCRPEFVESFAATAALALKRGVEGRPVEVRTPLDRPHQGRDRAPRASSWGPAASHMVVLPRRRPALRSLRLVPAAGQGIRRGRRGRPAPLP